MTKES